jgi:hypothetical protein
MTKSSVLAILAAAGIMYVGPMGDDAYALAKAIQAGDPETLEQFVAEYSDSDLRADAIILAANQRGQGTNSNSGQGLGGAGPGNPGNSNPVGNAGGYKH